jgi:hypothetical protein
MSRNTIIGLMYHYQKPLDFFLFSLYDVSEAMYIYKKNQDNIKKNNIIFKSNRSMEKSRLHKTWSC